MKLKCPISNLKLSIIFLLVFTLNACTPTKNLIYFQNLQSDTTLHTYVNRNVEVKIRKNDLLSINIISPDPEQNGLFNGLQGSTINGVESSVGGYLVDFNGNIGIYKIGTLHVEGMTRNELRSKLEKELELYLKNPVITIRFLSNHITILGEVAKPQILAIPNEQITLLEAISQSGDITFTGRKDNVLVIRETPEGKQFKRLNLSDNSIFSSPFYYLQPDDIVYVEPTKFKAKSNPQLQQTLSYVLTAASLLFTILVYIIR